ncbi:hypothetical protein JTE90_018220 [Oedothorax gibbosus]|uniref:Uncharacterized protein n=1 Tax=Oedothorax gibbosus TaxID=931172 RepID=A0AAV6U939_9ARAC|nr:hypothetical protein JTE90_018220 [Oedothorax gibbosus]
MLYIFSDDLLAPTVLHTNQITDATPSSSKRGATSSDRVAKYHKKMQLTEEKKKEGRPCHPTSGVKKGVE